MKRYELSIKISDEKYVDSLVISLARQGFAPYISSEDDSICIEVSSHELQELKDEG